MTMSLPWSKDFFLGIAISVAVATVYQIYRLFQEPSIEEMEARACAPMAKMSHDNKDDNGSSKNSITIFGFNAKGEHTAADRGILDASPFVMYVEMCCRIMGQAYTKEKGIPVESRFGPRHKLPVANVRGVVLDDSRKIVQEIQKQQQQQQHNIGGASRSDDNMLFSDANLNDDQRAMATLIENTLCHSLFWCLLYNKFDTHRGRNVFRRQLVHEKNNIPALPILRPLISAMAFRQMHTQLMGQGIARYPRVEVIDKARQDLIALSHILGSKNYILGNGESPSLTDAMMYSVLVLVLEDEELQVDLCSTTKEAHPNLVAFVNRMRMRYIPECSLLDHHDKNE